MTAVGSFEILLLCINIAVKSLLVINLAFRWPGNGMGTCKLSSHNLEPIVDKLFSIDVMQLLKPCYREQFI